jgi:hypothetical protein
VYKELELKAGMQHPWKEQVYQVSIFRSEFSSKQDEAPLFAKLISIGWEKAIRICFRKPRKKPLPTPDSHWQTKSYTSTYQRQT